MVGVLVKAVVAAQGGTPARVGMVVPSPRVQAKLALVVAVAAVVVGNNFLPFVARASEGNSAATTSLAGQRRAPLAAAVE